MKTNAELQKDVQDALKWEPLLHSAEIGVSVKNGVVSLTGVVDSYAKKAEAENAAKKIKGVTAIVENIEVHFPDSYMKSDLEIANEVLEALKANHSVPEGKVNVKVEDGKVTLDGELHWNYQKDAAKEAVSFLPGVKVIANNIVIKSEFHDKIEKKDIEKALKRSVIDDSKIHVSVLGTVATLTGKADSWHHKDEAGRIAWKTPGIWQVKNQLEVDYEYEYKYEL